MKRIGRKPQGVNLLHPLSGSDLAKRRMTLFLQTLSGETSVVQACAELNICESRFYGQRAEWLQESLALLEPRPSGRPAKMPATATPEEVRALRTQLRETEARAAALAVQAELAGTLGARLPSCKAVKKTTCVANLPAPPAQSGAAPRPR
jgi:hypothetical protein